MSSTKMSEADACVRRRRPPRSSGDDAPSAGMPSRVPTRVPTRVPPSSTPMGASRRSGEASSTTRNARRSSARRTSRASASARDRTSSAASARRKATTGAWRGPSGAFGACGACAGGAHVGEMPVRGLEGEAAALQRVAEDFAPDAVADADGDDAGRVPGEAAAVVAVAAEVGVGRGARLARQARSVRVPRGVGIAQQVLVALELETVVHAEGAHGDREARRMASVAVTPVDVEGGRQLVAIER